jgi:hypothetical protein
MSRLISRRRALILPAAALCAPAIVRAQVSPIPGVGVPTVIPTTAGFDPASLVTGAGGFWRADVGVSGSPVTTWNDQSHNAANLSGGAGVATKPTWSSTAFNTSFPGVIFDSTQNQNVVKTSFGFTSTTVSMFFLATINASQPNDVTESLLMGVINSGFSTGAPARSISAQQSTSKLFTYANANFNPSMSYTPGSPWMAGYIYDGVNVTAYTAITGGSSGAFSGTIGSGTSVMNIGTAAGDTFGTQMVMAYALLTDYALSGANRTSLKNWTNSHWGTSF